MSMSFFPVFSCFFPFLLLSAFTFFSLSLEKFRIELRRSPLSVICSHGGEVGTLQLTGGGESTRGGGGGESSRSGGAGESTRGGGGGLQSMESDKGGRDSGDDDNDDDDERSLVFLVTVGFSEVKHDCEGSGGSKQPL